ncbi:MAG: FmdB family zinc ribbon protein [Acidobacteriota bacterium]
MPLYPYRCTQCGHRFEKIQSFNSEPEKTCPKCGGVLERPLTAPGFQFKGAGWYVTDYASKGGSGANSAEGKTSSETPAPAQSKATAENKPSGASSGSASNSAASSSTPPAGGSKD